MAIAVAHPTRRNSRSVNVLPYSYYKVYQGTAAAMGTTDFLFDAISDIRFQTISTGGETIKIQGTVDGTNFDDLTPNNDTTGQPVSSVNLASGNYTLPLLKFGHYKQFKFVKSAAVQSGTAVFTVSKPWNAPGK